MKLGFYATRIQAQVMKEQDELDSAYDRCPDASLYWCFIDLKNSSNYRIVHGAKDGYIRAETFFALINEVIGPCPEIRLIKEIGDEVLLAATAFKPLFESLLLADHVARQLSSLTGSAQFPFGIRGAIGYGLAKRLLRRREDYLGSPIDRLARIMGTRSEVSNLLLDEEAYSESAEILKDYVPEIEIGQPRLIASEQVKGLLSNVYFREIIVARERLGETGRHFAPWRKDPVPIMSMLPDSLSDAAK
ncbi:MAG: hypothetical protein ACLGSH_11110 [Acidobacteriota bacterium]